jgi:hypothetical protein
MSNDDNSNDDLFSCYPYRPGNKGTDTSIAAGESVADVVAGLRGRALAAIAAAEDHGATSDELAEQFGMERHALRPRTAELRNMRKIADSGLRRLTVTGRKAIVWTLPEHVQASEREAA